MEARKESGSFRRGEMSLARKHRPGDPGVVSELGSGLRLRPRGARAARQPRPRAALRAPTPRGTMTSGHISPAPAPEQHARDGEVREAADAPRHQLQVRVRHGCDCACPWPAGRARGLRACAGGRCFWPVGHLVGRGRLRGRSFWTVDAPGGARKRARGGAGLGRKYRIS